MPYLASTWFLMQAGSTPSFGPVGGPEPNPTETVWTLGVGGAIVTPSIGQGFALTLATTLLNAGVAVSFTSSAALDAAVWPGGEEGVVLVPTVAWIDPTQATLTLSIAANQTVGLDQGSYRMQVGVILNGVRSLCYDGNIEITDSPGAVASTPVWATYEDMLYRSSQIRSLIPRAGVDVTNFLLERQEATEERKRQILLRYGPRNGFVKVRQNTTDAVLDSMDIPSPIAVPPSKADLTAALNTIGGIVLEAKLRNIIARDAISIVMRRQGPTNMSYVKEAEEQSAMADDAFRCYQAQVNTLTPITSPSPIGPISRFLIDHDCILLPTGTAP